MHLLPATSAPFSRGSETEEEKVRKNIVNATTAVLCKLKYTNVLGSCRKKKNSKDNKKKQKSVDCSQWSTIFGGEGDAGAGMRPPR